MENDTNEPIDSGETQEAITAPDRGVPHPRLPQYTVDEVERSIEVIKLLIKVRDRCRKQGLINW
ncbi:MAG: hypothetical protein IPK68_08830 [Bdellovibrionales bacterium]|nr:hypothetical protein [Bdellovibrionales bacterium]